MRTTRESITFDHPFSLAAVDKLQPAGTYAVDIDEELIEGLSFLAYRRVATNHLPATPSRQPRLGPGHQGRSSGVDGSASGDATRLRAAINRSCGEPHRLRNSLRDGNEHRHVGWLVLASCKWLKPAAARRGPL
jgi:hypothetical protein